MVGTLLWYVMTDIIPNATYFYKGGQPATDIEGNPIVTAAANDFRFTPPSQPQPSIPDDDFVYSPIQPSTVYQMCPEYGVDSDDQVYWRQYSKRALTELYTCQIGFQLGISRLTGSNYPQLAQNLSTLMQVISEMIFNWSTLTIGNNISINIEPRKMGFMAKDTTDQLVSRLLVMVGETMSPVDCLLSRIDVENSKFSPDLIDKVAETRGQLGQLYQALQRLSTPMPQ